MIGILLNDEREQGMVENRKTAIKNKVLEMGGAIRIFILFSPWRCFTWVVQSNSTYCLPSPLWRSYCCLTSAIDRAAYRNSTSWKWISYQMLSDVSYSTEQLHWFYGIVVVKQQFGFIDFHHFQNHLYTKHFCQKGFIKIYSLVISCEFLK